MHARDDYTARERRYAAECDDERRRSATLARLRLATFVAAAGALTWWLGFDGRVLAAAVTLLLLLEFAVLVVVHARVESRAEWCEALRGVNARALARLDRRWDQLPDGAPPPGIEVEQHPYAVDLDIFGRASVFQWIGPASTTFGQRALASWLLAPASSGEIVARQQAVTELAGLVDWRERLAGFGVLGGATRQESIDTFMRWAASAEPPMRAFGVIRALVYLTLFALWVPLLLHLSGVMPNGLWALPLVFGIALSFFTAGSVSHVFDQAGAGERTLRQYADVLAHIDAQPFTAPRLAAIKDRLTVQAGGRSAPDAMRALNRILGFADLRRGAALLHFPIQAFTLWDFHWLFAVERWRRTAGARVGGWLDAAGELDALSCLGGVRHDNPEWCLPEITRDPRYIAAALGHPLLPGGRRVANDVVLGPPGTVLLITGSNMSGKSTLLRAIGVNAVLAEAGAPVCAASLRLPPCDIQTSIRIQDSLERGVSYFMAALARLKRVIDAGEADAAARRAGEDRVLFYLLDEILQGTNSAERAIAVQAVARHLLDAGAIGAMSTHDLNLASEEPLRSHARLVHFTEIVDPDGTMRFDYRLREGLATSRNALRLMKLIGIDVAQQ
jgi:hypothetical protein